MRTHNLPIQVVLLELFHENHPSTLFLCISVSILKSEEFTAQSTGTGNKPNNKNR